MKSTVVLLLVALCCLVACPNVYAQETSPAPTVAPVPSIAPDADPATATRAWLDTVPADKRAKSDAYFEGGYWLILWNFLLAAAISIFLLSFTPLRPAPGFRRAHNEIQGIAGRALRYRLHHPDNGVDLPSDGL